MNFDKLLGHRVLIVLTEGRPIQGRFVGYCKGRMSVWREFKNKEKLVNIHKKIIKMVVELPEKSQDCLAYLCEVSQKEVTQKSRVTKLIHPRKRCKNG